jgi:type III secretory pathway component EscR
MGNIYWEEVVNFKEQVINKAQERIALILDDKIALAKQTLEEGIAFYNDFLEKQARYQQETLEQRLSEKAWIEQQRQLLTRVQTEIEAIANSH